MNDNNLIAVNQIRGVDKVTIHLLDGGTIDGEPYTVDAVGIVVEKGGDTNFVPWSYVKRVYLHANN